MNDNHRRLSAYLDDEMSYQERLDFEKDLQADAALRRELEGLERVRAWAEDFPGREPDDDVWHRIDEEIAVDATPSRRAWQSGIQGWSLGRLASMIPTNPDDWSRGVKRALVAGLGAIALGGMAHSYMTDQRAKAMYGKYELGLDQIVRLQSENSWRLTARDFEGEQFVVNCAAGGEPRTVWGTGIYTDDSSVCTAAAHQGLISYETGGVVHVERLPGRDRYTGSNQHGVESHEFGEWDSSFAFIDYGNNAGQRLGWASGHEVQHGETWEAIGWNASATPFRGQQGQELKFSCPSKGMLESRSVWGTGVYTDDSSICEAAVHAGVIEPMDGGLVTIRIDGKRNRFGGSQNHGVQSRSFGTWPGSFTFLAGPEHEPIVEPGIEHIEWRTDARELRLGVGQEMTVVCPPHGGLHPSVWGSEIYTHDSSICTAAVHDGRIDVERGGEVTVVGVPGRESYVGELRNGVESSSYNAWPLSFRFR